MTYRSSPLMSPAVEAVTSNIDNDTIKAAPAVRIWQTDWIGVLIALGALLLLPVFLIFLTWELFVLPLGALILLHFASHAALHRSLSRVSNTKSSIMNEMILASSFGLQALNYQMMTVAHLNHHALGLNAKHTPERYRIGGRLLSLSVYFFRLSFAQYLYWVAAGLFDGAIGILRRSTLIGKRSIRFHFPRGIALVCSCIPIACAIINPVTVLVTYAGYAAVWSLNQNAAHYYLDGWSRSSRRVASRTYHLHPFFERLTFGSFRHFEHHVFPRMGYHELTHPETLRLAERQTQLQVRTPSGAKELLLDLLIRQYSGMFYPEKKSSIWAKPQ